jgi:UDP-3-O-[3-hydroxymyristoyl] glucosamine N-acyltransferase
MTDATLEQLARMVGGQLHGDPGTPIRGARPLDLAGPDHITFVRKAAMLKEGADCRAGAVIVPPDCTRRDLALIAVDNPPAAFARIMRHFHPPRRPAPGVSPRAEVGGRLQAGGDLHVGALAFVGDDVVLGDRVTIHPLAYIGDGVQMGDDVEIHPRVVVMAGCRIGSRVTIHAGTVIGSDGFGFVPDGRHYLKMPHTGIVQIDDDVEIGANNTIDRATFGRTHIQRGVKIDNLVHVAHNVIVGEDTLLVSQVGISGSVTIGRHAILAGQAGISQHLTIGDDAIVGPQAGIGRDVPDGTVVSGSPEMPHRQWLRVQRVIPQLPQLKKRLAAMEKRLAALEGPDGEGDAAGDAQTT